MLAYVLTALSTTLTLQAPPAASDPIVVTGTRLGDHRAALAACLARNCPPDEDIDASAALAEALFVDGDYHEARTVLRQSIGRNRDQAARYPEPVSELYRANGRVARHLGLDGDARRSARETLAALQAGLPQEDHRHFTARLEVAESLIAFGDYNAARSELGRLASIARQAGRADVALAAEIRSLWATHLATPDDPRIIARLTRIAEAADSQQPAAAVGARLMLARIYRDRGDSARSEAIMTELARVSARRLLLHSPPYELVVREIRSNLSPAAAQAGSSQAPSTLDLIRPLRISDNFEDRWIDVGFWIAPDGRVRDLEIVRHSSSPDWADPLLSSIRGRIYSASDRGATYRLERYSYTAGFEARTGSHIPQRSPQARVEYLDLTGDERN